VIDAVNEQSTFWMNSIPHASSASGKFAAGQRAMNRAERELFYPLNLLP